MNGSYPKQLPDDLYKVEWYHEDFFENRELCFVHSHYHGIGRSLDMHRHNFYEINIVNRGVGRHYINDRSYPASVGCVFPLPPGVRHGYYNISDLNVFHILISCAFFEQYARELRDIPGCSLLFEIEPYLRSAFDQSLFLTLRNEQMSLLMPELDSLAAIDSLPVGGKDVLKDAKALYIIGLLSGWISSERHLAERANSEKYALDIVRSMAYIQTHYPEKLSVDALADAANMSRSTYLRHFGRIAKCSPLQYQTACRIKRAKELLVFTDLPAAQIAQECGFYDSSHLIRFFSKAEGMSPMLYRELDQEEAIKRLNVHS